VICCFWGLGALSKAAAPKSLEIGRLVCVFVSRLPEENLVLHNGKCLAFSPICLAFNDKTQECNGRQGNSMVTPYEDQGETQAF